MVTILDKRTKGVGDLKSKMLNVVKSECTLNQCVKDDSSLYLLRYIMMNPDYGHDSTLISLDD